MNSRSHNHSKISLPTVDIKTCALCFGPKGDEEEYGKFFQSETEQLAVHQFCLFFASGLAQNGEDSEGFDGFLFDDIRTEIKRAGKLPCTKCHIRGAATGCCIPKCRSAFHFCCGLKMSALFQFYGSFCAFCRKHRPSQSETIRTNAPLCPICLSNVDRRDGIKILSSPCCKNSCFHRTCVQKQALASGSYFFRCAICNNLEKFQKEMNRMGIYIPERDAVWEQGDAYADLLQRYNKCDTKPCLCPEGREFSGEHNGKQWQICLCYTCGQTGTHVECKGWSNMPTQWLCQDCDSITSKTGSRDSNDVLLSHYIACIRKRHHNDVTPNSCPNGSSIDLVDSSSDVSSIADLGASQLESLDSDTGRGSSKACKQGSTHKKITVKGSRMNKRPQKSLKSKAKRKHASKKPLNLSVKKTKRKRSKFVKKTSLSRVDGSFSLSLDVSVESDIADPPCASVDDKLDDDIAVFPSHGVTSSKSSRNENPTQNTCTPTRPPSSPKESPSLTQSPRCSRQLDLLSMLSSFKAVKMPISHGWKDVTLENRSPKTSSDTRRSIKRRKLDVLSHKSITTYMTSSNLSPPKRKSRETISTSTDDTSKSIPTQSEPRPASTKTNFSESCFEAARQVFDHAIQKLSGVFEKSANEDDFVQKSTAVPAVKKSVAEDSDTDSSNSIKVVKVIQKRVPSEVHCGHGKFRELYTVRNSSDSIVIDDDVDEHDSGKGESRDNSDAGTSYVSSTDSKGNDEEMNGLVGHEINISGSSADVSDDGLFLSCDEDSLYFNCNSPARDGDHNAANEMPLTVSPSIDSGRKRKFKEKKHTSYAKERKAKKMKKKESLRTCDDTGFTPSSLQFVPVFNDGAVGKDDADSFLLSTHNATSQTSHPSKLDKKTHSSGSHLSSSDLGDSSSAETFKPLKKKHRSSLSPKGKMLSLLKYSECSDEDFQSRKRKRKDFKLAICRKTTKGLKKRKKHDESIETLDLSSEAFG